MSKTVLVTGINGFVGPHVARELLSRDYTVVGCGTEAESIVEGIDYVTANLMEANDVDGLPWTNIDAVIHLAGLSAVGPSFDAPAKYMNLNPNMAVELFEAASRADRKPRMLIVSTGAVYAPSADPIDESAEIKVSSPYVASKLATELVAQYYANRGFETASIRPMNHIGPGQGLGFLISDLAQQIVAIERGEAEAVQAGNLETKRDYTDVRDIARAYADLVDAESLDHDVYNFCSGVARSGQEIFTGLCQAAGLNDVQLEIDQSKIRPTDNPIAVGDFSRLQSQTGWTPKIGLAKTLEEVIEQWRNA